jgi:hypothetical protein
MLNCVMLNWDNRSVIPGPRTRTGALRRPSTGSTRSPEAILCSLSMWRRARHAGVAEAYGSRARRCAAPRDDAQPNEFRVAGFG